MICELKYCLKLYERKKTVKIANKIIQAISRKGGCLLLCTTCSTYTCISKKMNENQTTKHTDRHFLFFGEERTQ